MKHIAKKEVYPQEYLYDRYNLAFLVVLHIVPCTLTQFFLHPSFVGCMFLGGGLGYLLLNDQWWAGGIIGMGVGFLARAVWLGWKGRDA